MADSTSPSNGGAASPEGVRRFAASGLDRAGAVDWARHFLTAGLDPALRYHRLAHTSDEVVPVAAELAGAEGLDAELDVIIVGAWFHDIGHVVQPREHEAIGMGIAAAVLPGFGFGPTEVAAVCDVIEATRLPQTPRSPAAAVVADADLAVLGTDRFRSRNEDLRIEMAGAGSSASLADWYRGQIAFLENHSYVTRSARDRWDDGKQANLAWLRRQEAAHR